MDNTKNDAKVERAFRDLVGLTHHYFKYFDFNVLILFCDEATWNGTDEQNTRWRIWVECDWRLKDQYEIVAYNNDDSDRIFREFGPTKGKRITRFTSTGLSAQLVFDGGMTLEIITGQETEDHWELRRSDGYRVSIDQQSITETFYDPDR